MKSIVTALTLVLLACGVTSGQDESAPVSEHLKCFGPFIGNWRHEGPSQRDIEGIAEKGPEIVVQISLKHILNGSAVESNWSVEIQGGAELLVKTLNGWDAKEEKIVQYAMGSFGGISVGSVTHDKAAKSLTISLAGVDGAGEEISSVTVLTKTGKDTLTSQTENRKGGIVVGPSYAILHKRVERKKKAAK